MKEDEEDELSFIHIATATANVVRYLQANEEKKERPESQGQGRNEDESKRARELEYIERRLADLRAFERRAANGPRRKRE